jgi:hypothetical protein
MCDDVENQEKSDSSEYETDEEWEVERKKQQAAMEKDSVGILGYLLNKMKVFQQSEELSRTVE